MDLFQQAKLFGFISCGILLDQTDMEPSHISRTVVVVADREGLSGRDDAAVAFPEKQCLIAEGDECLAVSQKNEAVEGSPDVRSWTLHPRRCAVQPLDRKGS